MLIWLKIAKYLYYILFEKPFSHKLDFSNFVFIVMGNN